MAHGAGLGLTITRLTRLIRQRRALYYGVRGLVWGLCLAIIAVALRAMIGPWALPLAGALGAGGALLGILYGVLLRVPPVDALGLADRAFDLKDRLATAHDLLGRADRSGLADAAPGQPSADTFLALFNQPRMLAVPKDGAACADPIGEAPGVGTGVD